MIKYCVTLIPGLNSSARKEVAMSSEGEDPDIGGTDEYDEQQASVDRAVRWGLVFGIFWLGGIGSIIALVSGIRARRMIAASDGGLIGNGRALACILIGAAGMLIWLPILVIGLVNQF
jgi:hypothetical protein